MMATIIAGGRNEEGTPSALAQWPILTAWYLLILAHPFLLIIFCS